MAVEGTVQPSYEPVRDAFEHVIDTAPGTGAAVAVWHDGAWVVDLWGGWADAARHTTVVARQPGAALLGEQTVRRRVCVELSSTAGWSASTTGPAVLAGADGRRPRCGSCCLIRAASSPSMTPHPPRSSSTGMRCARCWPTAADVGRRARHMANPPCSTGICWARSSAESTVARSAGTCATRCVGRVGWTSASASTRRSTIESSS